MIKVTKGPGIQIRKGKRPFRAHTPRKREIELIERKRAKLHVKTGDLVEILAGRSRGHQGRVLRVLKAKARAVVEGANMVKRHVKPGPKTKGGILDVESPIHVSNLRVVESVAG